MRHLQNLFYIILLHSISGAPQLNLYHTDWIDQSQNENGSVLQHNCLRLVLGCLYDRVNLCELISYCMNELPSQFIIENTQHLSQFTFAQLAQQNITSYQLYLWSTPIDTIERYQLYRNQLSTLHISSYENEIFYNCTLPRFGPMCQYQLYSHSSDHSSLDDIVNHFYETYGYHPTSLTCYTHLECNRGPSPACLDWSEICDGKIDCLNNGVDEEHCWQIEINECKEDEYRCRNGQCVPGLFLSVKTGQVRYCFDASEAGTNDAMAFRDGQVPPEFIWEDITCSTTPLTSSCKPQREKLLIEAMYSSKQSSTSEECWSAFQRMFTLSETDYLSNEELHQLNKSIEIIMNICPNVTYFANHPVLFGDIYFAYIKNHSQHLHPLATKNSYICYNSSNYDHYFIHHSKILLNQMKCIDFTQFLVRPHEDVSPMKSNYEKSISKVYEDLLKYHLRFTYNSTICNRSNMYQCRNSSKCISVYRLLDGTYDCPHMDDENQSLVQNMTQFERIKSKYLYCSTTNQYITESLRENGVCNCDSNEYGFCDDEYSEKLYTQRNIIFQRICDGFTQLIPVLVGDRNETDETECEQWECDNLYTSCDYGWNCPNGVDETGCTTYSTINCSLNFHYCVSPSTYKLFCLPVEQVNDDHIDCLGATDESRLCNNDFPINIFSKYMYFYCINRSSSICLEAFALCNGTRECEHGDDEQFCSAGRVTPDSDPIPPPSQDKHFSDEEEVIKRHVRIYSPGYTTYFVLDDLHNTIEYRMKNMEDLDISSALVTRISDQYQVRCHRGLDLIVWSNNTNQLSTLTCLCPSSYYGDQCQFQNQRVSLIIKFQALSDSWRTLFAIVILLIDDTHQRIVHSYEQITFLYTRNCYNRYDMYLVYSTRPKHPTNNYSIHIDIYEKQTLKYRGSLLYPLHFSFLPVHRLTYHVTIPRNDEKRPNCLTNPCIHGQCIRYSNYLQNDISFCQCQQGWSGRYCSIEYTSKCSSNSTDIGITANNQSICVCPLHTFGSRCLLTDPICLNDDNSTCLNDGKCIPTHHFMISSQTFTCLCPEGYSGERCEIVDNKIILSFHKDIHVPQSVFIHFFYTLPVQPPQNTTTVKTVILRQDSITIHWTERFHLVFIQFPTNNHYYLALVQKTYRKSAIIERTIHPSHRCPHIRELFNHTFMQLHLIHRIKYYHLPCQNSSSDLSCFYDEVHLCICYQFHHKRLANCMNFVHNVTYNCVGKSECENDAQCFQDKPTCPTRSICMCEPCYYGSRCQFSTSGFGLSLDGILGYHILPNVTVTHQSPIVQFSLVLTIIFIILGSIDGILCLMTFKNKTVCEVGCGLYLLCLSVMTLLTMIMFGLKFFILLLAQMTLISNRLFLEMQCYSVDLLLQICLNMSQWLNACIAIERAYTVIEAVRFDKKKSKQRAKYVIIVLVLFVIGTCVHDPVYRALIDEENDSNEKRTWCIVRYSFGLQMYNYIIHIIHFFGPFMINLISSIILIIKNSHQQANIHTLRAYRVILREQIREHRHILIAPCVLVIVALPRLVLTFVSKCMKSVNEAWLFVIVYFISFIPSMVNFLVFIIPSKFYKKELKKSIVQFQTFIRRRLRMISQVRD